MKEIWKKIKNFENYEVSNLGNVKSLQYNKQRLLKFKKNKQGYEMVGLFNENIKNKKIFVHRLVAEEFLNKNNFKSMPNENKENVDLNDLEVNHKDGNKANNNVNNLEWCTKSYNQKHSYLIGLKNAKKGYKNYRSKPITQCNLDGSIIKEWSNKREIERNLGYNNGNISACCKHRIHQAYGYIWEYKED